MTYVSGTSTPHRTDIDGLRAIAVLPIFLFHLGLAGLGGGFVGVDVFFVISGFLIGGTTIRELNAGSFSIARFYQRRLRRILPALIAMLVGTTIAAWFVLLPSEMEDYAASALSTTAFGANIYFWLNAGYFGAASTSLPLLHAWSLGVEEQYYLFFPLLAMVVVRIWRRLMWSAVVMLAILSLALSIWLTKTAPDANFYLLPTRAWELLAGVLVAITPLPLLDRRLIREAATACGLAAIAYAVLRYSLYTPFPGLRALAPCMGAAIIIAAGSRGTTLIGRMLSFAPVRFLGVISYSLYLWHWPVIVLMLQGLPADQLSPAMQLVAGVVSLLLAVLSWRCIETPTRRSKASPQRVFAISGVAAATVSAMCAALIATHGMTQRFSPEVNRLASMLDYPHAVAFRQGTCFLTPSSRRETVYVAQCLTAKEGLPSVLLVGDSHAAHLYPGLRSSFPGSNILQANSAGCRPVTAPPPNSDARCARLMRWVFGRYIRVHRPDLVVLAGRWMPEDFAGLGRTLTDLRQQNVRVIVVGPAPVWRNSVPRLLAFANLRGDLALPQRFIMTDRWAIDLEIARIAARSGADYVSLLRALCTPDCRTTGPSGEPMVFDDSHFTEEGSALVAKLLHDPALRMSATQESPKQSGAEPQRAGP